MKLVPINSAALKIGRPLPFGLRTGSGQLLAHRGFVVETREAMDELIKRGIKLYVDLNESEEHHRAFVGKLHGMVDQESTLGIISDVKVSPTDLARGHGANDGREMPDWRNIQSRAHLLLSMPDKMDFVTRLNRLNEELLSLAERTPDALLFALFHLASTELRAYSATHGLLVHAICTIAAKDVLKWDAALIKATGRAALTMNLSMTQLQDQLIRQSNPLSASQRKNIDKHPEDSAVYLERLGVTDELWLSAVLHHHDKTPGKLADRPVGRQIARLIHRADIFTARLAPRVSRLPMSAAAAMQASYYDEEKAVDEAGTALIKAVGVYSPGSFVRLASEEVGIVIRRGADTATPRVAVLFNRNGLPTAEPLLRDSGQPGFKIVAGLPRRDVKVVINLDRMLALI